MTEKTDGPDVTTVTLERPEDLTMFQLVVQSNTMGTEGTVLNRDSDQSPFIVRVSCSPKFLRSALDIAEAQYTVGDSDSRITLQSLPARHAA